MKSGKVCSTSSLWGELPFRETPKQEAVTPDIIENIYRQVMDESNNSDCEYQTTRQQNYIEMPLGNKNVLNTINLHNQLRIMECGTILRTLSVIEEDNRNESFTLSINDKQRKVFKNKVNLPHITPDAAKFLLEHAVTVLVAHIGYEKASNVALSLLTDVADYFLRRLTMLLKIASEQPNSGFPDAVTQVFTDSNIGGIEGIYNYYQDYILSFEANMKKKVEKKMEEQRQMEENISNVKMELEEVANNLQFEDLSEFANVYQEVPTLQLLDPDIGFPTSLDAGFQMLHSLEQDELNGLEVEEDHHNRESPNSSQKLDIRK